MPGPTAAVSLVGIGATAARNARRADRAVSAPVFRTVVLAPLTCSITAGVGTGAVFRVAVKAAARGKFRQAGAFTGVPAAVFLSRPPSAPSRTGSA
ncbi:hypothetical protein [Streptomyces sp. BBFR102]|uniref:hypothetical protein n=1 Tax=Streptomyces sp. BBFR102 TaxID=3448171 RepID=UPI003F5319A0